MKTAKIEAAVDGAVHRIVRSHLFEIQEAIELMSGKLEKLAQARPPTGPDVAAILNGKLNAHQEQIRTSLVPAIARIDNSAEQFKQMAERYAEISRTMADTRDIMEGMYVSIRDLRREYTEIQALASKFRQAEPKSQAPEQRGDPMECTITEISPKQKPPAQKRGRPAKR